MFDKVLFPTDFSEYATKTLEYIWSLENIGVQTVVMLNILPTIEEYPVMLARTEKVRLLLDDEAKILRDHGLKVETRVETGTAYRKILDVAEEEDASMIVIGCHGEGLQGVVVGSVADRVTRESPIPVMLVKYKIKEDSKGRRLEKVTAESFKKVLYPTDFSGCSTRTFEYVREFRKVGCEEVIIASIVDPRTQRAGDNADQAVTEAEKKLQVIKQELVERGLKATIVVRSGSPLEQLLQIAKEERVSMICLGSTGKGFFQEMIMGSVSESIVRKARCPVLVIHDEVCTLSFD